MKPETEIAIPKIDKYNFKDEVKYVFYQLPKLLVHGKYYKDVLTHSDMVVYQLLLDRLSVSKKNNWVDEEGNYYLYYTNSELQEVLNIGKQKISIIKNRLSAVNLLIEERTGRSNRIYLSKPQAFNETEAKHILEINEKELEDKTKMTEEEKRKISETQKSNKNAQKTDEVRKSNVVLETLSEQQSDESGKQTMFENQTSEVRKSNASKKNLIRTKDIKDNKDQQTTENDLFKNGIQKAENNLEMQKEFIDSYIELYSLDLIFGNQIIQAMKNYSFGSFETFKLYTDKLIYGLSSAEKIMGYEISFIENDEMSFTLNRIFKNVLLKNKKGELNSYTDYLFTSFKNCFIDYAKSKQEQMTDSPNIKEVIDDTKKMYDELRGED